MSLVNRLIYTLAKYDPSEVDGRKVDGNEQTLADIEEHFELIGMLSDVGAIKYENLLLAILKYVKWYLGLNDERRSKVESDMAGDFNDDDYYTATENDKLFLVERICLKDDSGEEVYSAPLNVWSIDTRIVKATIIRRMCHAQFSRQDEDVVRWVYKINKDPYYGVRIGSAGGRGLKSDDYINQYYKYLYEYYLRSPDPDPSMLSYYSRLNKYNAENFVHNSKDVEGAVVFRFAFEFGLSAERADCNIDEFCSNVKSYVKRLYEVNCRADWCRASYGKGKSSYQEQFKMFARGLIAYDLLSPYVNDNISIDDDSLKNKIATVGRMAMKAHEEEFKNIGKIDAISIRKEFRKDFKNALKLIEQSKEGFLSLLDPTPSV